MARSRSTAARAVTSTPTPRQTRFPQFRGQRVVRRWRYRMAPDPLTRKPKGLTTVLGTRQAAASGRGGSGRFSICGRWLPTLGLGRRRRGNGVHQLPDHALRVPTAVWPRPRALGRRRRVPADDGRARRGSRSGPGNRIDILNNGDAVLSRDARGDRQRRRGVDHDRGLHLLGGRRSAASSPRRWRRRRASGVRVKILLDAVGSDEHRRGDPRDSGARAAASSPGTTRSGITASDASTIARIASRSSSTAASRSPAAPALPTTGRATRGIRASGATCRSGSKGRRSRRCRPASRRTGCRRPAS